MEEITDLGDDAETSLILFLLKKKKIPDLLSLAKTLRERGYGVISEPGPG